MGWISLVFLHINFEKKLPKEGENRFSIYIESEGWEFKEGLFSVLPRGVFTYHRRLELSHSDLFLKAQSRLIKGTFLIYCISVANSLKTMERIDRIDNFPQFFHLVNLIGPH
jgi:hypothetical protein